MNVILIYYIVFFVEWVNQKSSKPVSTKMLIDYINKMASNKRKYQKSTESHLKNKTQQVKREKKINESPYKTTIQGQHSCSSRNDYKSQTDRIGKYFILLK